MVQQNLSMLMQETEGKSFKQRKDDSNYPHWRIKGDMITLTGMVVHSLELVHVIKLQERESSKGEQVQKIRKNCLSFIT